MGPRQTHGRHVSPPWAEPHFWILQLIVLAIYLVRLALTLALDLRTGSLGLELSTFALFLVPVLVAALYYGLSGALITAGWVTILAIPRVASAVASHDTQAAWLEVVQIWLLDVIAALIGQRVSNERAARELVDAERRAHLRAEALYRDLFDSNKAPILIVDPNGIVVDTNAAAVRAFGSRRPSAEKRPPDAASAVRLVDMIGPEAAAVVLSRLVAGQHSGEVAREAPSTEEADPIELEIDGRPVVLRPTATMLGGPYATRQMQVVFEDVTAETRRRDRMEAYAAKVVTGQEEERRRIAHELHDGPVQMLVHLCRQIDEIDSHPAARQGSASSLAGLRRTVEQTVAELRTIAKGLRPPILDDLGLVASINQMLTESAARGHFDASFGVTGRVERLSPAVELALFRIAQEALSNVERHAAARRVAVGLDFESGGLRMLVKDDGIGFDAAVHDGRDRGSSLGVPGMTERANLIGSRLTIHSVPGSGTTIDVSVPPTIIGCK